MSRTTANPHHRRAIATILVVASSDSEEERKRRLGGALEAEASAKVDDSNIAHFEFWMVKNGYIWNFTKADGYSIGIGTKV